MASLQMPSGNVTTSQKQEFIKQLRDALEIEMNKKSSAKLNELKTAYAASKGTYYRCEAIFGDDEAIQKVQKAFAEDVKNIKDAVTGELRIQQAINKGIVDAWFAELEKE